MELSCPLSPYLITESKAGFGWSLLLSSLLPGQGASPGIEAIPGPHSDVFDCSDIFKVSCSSLATQQGCALSWRGRQHRVVVIPSSVENSWDISINSCSFHPTSFDPFWKGCLFPLSFHLSQQKAWAYSSPVAPGHSSPALQPPCDCLAGSVGARGREETQHLCTLEPFTMTFVADGTCLVVLVKSC